MKTMLHSSRHRNGTSMDAVRQDIATLKHDVAALISNGVGAAGDQARETLARAGESASAVANQAKRRVSSLHKGLGNAAATRPITTIAVAAATGAVCYGVLRWMRQR